VLLKISDKGQSILYTFATVLMVTIWNMKEDIEMNLPLMKLMENKESEMEVFVANLTCSDSKADDTLAVHFVK